MASIIDVLKKQATDAKKNRRTAPQAAPKAPAPKKSVAAPKAPAPQPPPPPPGELEKMAMAAGLNFGGMTQQGVGVDNKVGNEDQFKDETKRGQKVKALGQYIVREADYEDMMNMMKNLGPAGIAGQDAVNKQLEETIARLQNQPLRELDLRPIAAGLDNLFGFNFSKTTPAPFRAADRDREIAAAQADLSKLYGDQGKNEVSNINAMILDQPGYIENTGTQTQGTTNTQATSTTTTTEAKTPPPRRGTGAPKEIDTRPFADRLQKDGIIEMQNILRNINTRIPGGMHGWNGQDLPGFGKGTGALARNLPFGESFTADGGLLVQDVQSFNNVVMRARSGGAITPQEADRLTLELGMGISKGPEHLITALKRAESTLNEMIRNRAAGEKPGVLEAYLQRSQNPNIGQLQGAGSGAAVAPPTTSGGKKNVNDLINRMKARGAK